MNCYELIQELSDGAIHSGEEIGRRFGVSRSAVWKVIRQIKKYGFRLDVIKGHGYQISGGVDLLDKQKILIDLGSQVDKIISLELFQEIDSTNKYLLSELKLDENHGYQICLSESQINGRGRRGKSWISPYAQNLYLSMAFRLNGSGEALAGLSLMIGVSIYKVLSLFGVDIKLKWPNDVLVDGKKLAGVLIELSGVVGEDWDVVAGIGLNVHMNESALTEEIDQDWVSLDDCCRKGVKRNELTAKLISQLIKDIENFRVFGFKEFKEIWSTLDVFKGKKIRTIDGKIKGIGCGIDDKGHLLIETSKGVESIASGEVSSIRYAS
jgi:BirA family biotin operon repressor/biotin-[acetyl-CoA-carboxylase] ligase